MKKFALLSVVALSFGFSGCASAPKDNWRDGLDQKQGAQILGKEMKMVPMRDHSGMETPEYRVDLIWDDMKRKTYPTVSVVVALETYQSVNASDWVILLPGLAINEGGHVVVSYWWKHEPSGRAYEVLYRFDTKDTGTGLPDKVYRLDPKAPESGGQ